MNDWWEQFDGQKTEDKQADSCLNCTQISSDMSWTKEGCSSFWLKKVNLCFTTGWLTPSFQFFLLISVFRYFSLYSEQLASFYLVENVLQYVLNKACIGIPGFYCQHTFALPLEQNGTDCRPGFDLSQSVVLMPVHQASISHWVLYVLFTNTSQVVLLDSITQKNQPCLSQLKAYLRKWFPSKRWQYTKLKVPLQKNGTDCGIYVCVFAQIIAASPVPQARLKSADPFFSAEQEADIKRRLPVERQRIWNELAAVAVPNQDPICQTTDDIEILSVRPAKRVEPEAASSCRAEPTKKRSSQKLARPSRPLANKRWPSKGE